MARSFSQQLGDESCPRQPASKVMGASVLQQPELNSANNMDEFGRDPSPEPPARDTASPPPCEPVSL